MAVALYTNAESTNTGPMVKHCVEYTAIRNGGIITLTVTHKAALWYGTTKNNVSSWIGYGTFTFYATVNGVTKSVVFNNKRWVGGTANTHYVSGDNVGELVNSVVFTLDVGTDTSASISCWSTSTRSTGIHSVAGTVYFPAAEGPVKPTIALNKSVMRKTDTVTITPTCTDYGDGSLSYWTYQYRKNAGSWTTFSGPTFMPDSAGGTHGDVFEFRVKATNSLGLDSIYSTDYDSITCASLPTNPTSVIVDSAVVAALDEDFEISWSGEAAGSGTIVDYAYSIYPTRDPSSYLLGTISASPLVLSAEDISANIVPGDELTFKVQPRNSYSYGSEPVYTADDIVQVAVAPTAPTVVYVPTQVYIGYDMEISWVGAAAGTGALSLYEIEAAVINETVQGAWQELDTISAINTQRTVTAAEIDALGAINQDSLIFRVRAIDIYAIATDYTESSTVSVIGGILYLKDGTGWHAAPMYLKTASDTWTPTIGMYLKVAEDEWEECIA